MPIHDWAKAPAGLFHHFHQCWAVALADGLNAGVLPPDYFALVETRADGWEPDVLALATGRGKRPSAGPRNGAGGTATLPRTRFVFHETDADVYARRANQVSVRNDAGELVSVIEIVSPGNKDSRNGIAGFVRKTTELLNRGIHLLVIDLFPPTPRDPAGIHKVIWDEFHDDPFDLPADKPLVLASYMAEGTREAYIEVVAVGDTLPAMPVFLYRNCHVLAPLEVTYQRTWEKCPSQFRELIQNPELPG
ncbi:MAG: DUF4058 family protein [Fimbriiglobus sp.]